MKNLRLIFSEVLDAPLMYPTVQKRVADLQKQLSEIGLYEIDDYILVNAKDYGVPQSRERVLFIANRCDVSAVDAIAPTETSWTIRDAIDDLKDTKSGETETTYQVELSEQNSEYIRDSRLGRLRPDLQNRIQSTTHNYVASAKDLQAEKFKQVTLANHEIATHSQSSLQRLAIIQKHGNYDKATDELVHNLKPSRNYTVLKRMAFLQR